MSYAQLQAAGLVMHNVVRKLRIVPEPQAKNVKHHVQNSLVVSTNMFGCEMLSCTKVDLQQPKLYHSMRRLLVV